MSRLELLKGITFGSQVAEEETQKLASYFVETDQWSRIERGEIDLVKGEKGSGKSAIYSLLSQKEEEFFQRSILFVTAENPRGTTVFKDLVSVPPTGQTEFVILWKLYVITIIAKKLREYDLKGKKSNILFSALEGAKLLDQEREYNLSGLLRIVQEYTKKLLSFESLEGGVNFDPATGLFSGFSGKISVKEPIGDLKKHGFNSIDNLFSIANELLEENNYSVWVLFDRLDVAFSENHDLEANAIKALMKAYQDIAALDRIHFKIFLRDDIWKRITLGGMREASHITKITDLRWNQSSLLNLMIRRLLSNKKLVEELGVDIVAVLKSAEAQEEFFYKVFPKQVEAGLRKPSTLTWMVSRCADGTGETAPRELIHLMNSVKDEEIKRLEKGGKVIGEGFLVDRLIFKDALPSVSMTRLNSYLYAEYPDLQPYVAKLLAEKTEHSLVSLATIWNVTQDEAEAVAQRLIDVGFFVKRGARSAPMYWVPFLYRDSLNMIQGKADED